MQYFARALVVIGIALIALPTTAALTSAVAERWRFSQSADQWPVGAPTGDVELEAPSITEDGTPATVIDDRAGYENQQRAESGGFSGEETVGCAATRSGRRPCAEIKISAHAAALVKLPKVALVPQSYRIFRRTPDAIRPAEAEGAVKSAPRAF
jgi:hypothetical protein